MSPDARVRRDTRYPRDDCVSLWWERIFGNPETDLGCRLMTMFPTTTIAAALVYYRADGCASEPCYVVNRRLQWVGFTYDVGRGGECLPCDPRSE